MWLLNPKTSIISIITAFIVIFLVIGCADNPEDKAAKQLHESTAEAIELARSKGDFEKAGPKQIKAAIRNAALAGDAVSPAYLASGNITFSQAKDLRTSLSEQAQSINSILGAISRSSHEMNDVLIQQDRLDNLSEAMKEEVKQLKAIIDGGGGKTGIKQALAKENAALQRLRQQMAQFEKQMRDAQDEIDEIQNQVDEKLYLAESASGDKKFRLNQERLELIQEKNEYFIKAQEALDEVKSFEDKIALIEPLIEKYQADEASVRQQLSKAEKSTRKNQLKTQLREVKKQIDEYNQQITQMTTGLQNAGDDHSGKIEEIDSLLESAIKDYKKIRSKAVRKMADVRLADTYSFAASTAKEVMEFERHISSRLKSIAAVGKGGATNALGKIASQYERDATDHGQKAMENFDLAIEAYAKLQKSLRGKGDDLAENVTNSHLLALYGKVVLAGQLGQDDVVDETLNQADELIETAGKRYPDLVKSVAVKLMDGSAEYTPSMAVDATLYYEGMKEQFQLWKTLKGEEKTREMERLLENFSDIEPEDAEVFDRLIGPELQLLNDEMAGALEARATLASDPNNY